MSYSPEEKIVNLQMQLLDLQGQLEAERGGHERYRELTRTNLAETAWKQDNDKLRAELAELRAVPRFTREEILESWPFVDGDQDDARALFLKNLQLPPT